MSMVLILYGASGMSLFQYSSTSRCSSGEGWALISAAIVSHLGHDTFQMAITLTGPGHEESFIDIEVRLTIDFRSVAMTMMEHRASPYRENSEIPRQCSCPMTVEQNVVRDKDT